MPDTKPLVVKLSNEFYNVNWTLNEYYTDECRYLFEFKSLIASVTAESTQSYQWGVFNRSMFIMGINQGTIAKGREPSMLLAMHMCMCVLTSIYDYTEIQSCSKLS